MLFAFVGLAILACMSVGFVSYLVSYNLQIESSRAHYSQLLNQAAEEVDWKLQSVENAAKQMSLDINLQKMLRQTTQGYSVVEFQQYISRYSTAIINMLPVDCRVEVYVTNETLPELYINTSVTQSNKVPLPSRWMEILRFSRLQALPWSKKVVALTQHDILWLQVGNDFQNGTITYVDNIYDMDTFVANGPVVSRLALLLFNTKLADLVDIASMQEEGMPVRFSIKNSDGKEVFSSLDGAAGSNGNSWHGNEIRLEQAVPLARMTLEAYVPMSGIYIQARKALLLSLASTLGLMLVFSAVALLLSRYFSRRIRQVVDFINTVRDGEFKNRLTVPPRDELYLISTALNDMTETIDRLVETVYLSKLEKTQAQLDLLRLQINPHLLYNSLSSVGNMIQLGMNEKALEIIMALTSFYRLSLSSGKSLIPLREELEHVKEYVKVRAAQFNGNVAINYDISQETEGIMVPKIILQPLVENVFKHAAQASVPLSIQISSAVARDKVIIGVRDNGPGIDPNTVERLNSMEGEGSGLKNVFQRICLQFGEESGGNVRSFLGAGTLVELIIPILKNE